MFQSCVAHTPAIPLLVSSQGAGEAFEKPLPWVTCVTNRAAIAHSHTPSPRTQIRIQEPCYFAAPRSHGGASYACTTSSSRHAPSLPAPLASAAAAAAAAVSSCAGPRTRCTSVNAATRLASTNPRRDVNSARDAALPSLILATNVWMRRWRRPSEEEGRGGEGGPRGGGWMGSSGGVREYWVGGRATRVTRNCARCHRRHRCPRAGSHAPHAIMASTASCARPHRRAAGSASITISSATPLRGGAVARLPSAGGCAAACAPAAAA